MLLLIQYFILFFFKRQKCNNLSCYISDICFVLCVGHIMDIYYIYYGIKMLSIHMGSLRPCFL